MRTYKLLDAFEVEEIMDDNIGCVAAFFVVIVSFIVCLLIG